mgnify:CR=1 FL=1
MIRRYVVLPDTSVVVSTRWPARRRPARSSSSRSVLTPYLAPSSCLTWSRVSPRSQSNPRPPASTPLTAPPASRVGTAKTSTSPSKAGERTAALVVHTPVATTSRHHRPPGGRPTAPLVLTSVRPSGPIQDRPPVKPNASPPTARSRAVIAGTSPVCMAGSLASAWSSRIRPSRSLYASAATIRQRISAWATVAPLALWYAAMASAHPAEHSSRQASATPASSRRPGSRSMLTAPTAPPLGFIRVPPGSAGGR